jgi:predicted O-methyltransferase YrrM
MAKSIKTSTWINNAYSYFFYGLVRGLKPRICVELGTYAGFSAYFIALALKDNNFGALDCYDLWESYEFNKVPKKMAENNLHGLPVNLIQEDGYTAFANYEDNTVDLLNVDLSNDGSTYLSILDQWYPILKKGSLVLMEGGTSERDNIEWMLRYNKMPICRALDNEEIKGRYHFNVIPDFPGLTILEKK